jgi:hypothetical protein
MGSAATAAAAVAASKRAQGPSSATSPVAPQQVAAVVRNRAASLLGVCHNSSCSHSNAWQPQRCLAATAMPGSHSDAWQPQRAGTCAAAECRTVSRCDYANRPASLCAWGDHSRRSTGRFVKPDLQPLPTAVVWHVCVGACSC